MAAKLISNEAIELTEKKMDMTLDEIIKLSKNKPKKNQRTPNKSNNPGNNFSGDKSAKVQKFMDTRSTIRQGALAQKRSNFQRNQFPLASEAARKAAAVPIRNKPFGGTKTGNMNKLRVNAPNTQNRAVRNGSGFNTKGPVFSNGSQQFKRHAQPKPKPQTLDSLFANMKEERMRMMSRQNGNGHNAAGGTGGYVQNHAGRRNEYVQNNAGYVHNNAGYVQNNAGRRNENGQNNVGYVHNNDGYVQNNAGRRNENGQNNGRRRHWNAGRGNGNGQNMNGRRNGNAGGQQLPPWQRAHYGQ